jgi:hypothetical protein
MGRAEARPWILDSLVCRNHLLSRVNFVTVCVSQNGAFVASFQRLL